MVAVAGWQMFGRSCKLPQNKLEEPHYSSSSWYYSKKEIEENSPSRKDGIDLRNETCLRKLYCSFLQELGIKLKVPQVTIATAVMFCHRFFLGQSHAKNDWQTIATTCMFLAGKVEETPVMLRDIVVVAHSIIHKRDPVSAERIKQWETYQEKKELILLAERLLLSTIGFDFNIIHPYKLLVTAIKNLKLGQSELAKVSWNTLNDCLQTTLCLQFKPAYIAAGAMYLAAKVTNFKLPSHGGKVWWQEFDVSPFQLEEVIKQMVDLFIPNGRSFSHPLPESSSKPLSNFDTAARDGLGNSFEKSSDQSQNPVSVEVHVESGRSEVQPEAQHCEDVTMETSSDSMDLLEDGPQQKQGGHQCNINGDSEMWIGVEISGVKKGNQKLSVNVISDVDKERIRAALKRRREGCAVKRAAVITNEEDDYVAWIEKELEDGIELAKPAECKLRYEENAFDAWVEKELEDGIELAKPAECKLRYEENAFDAWVEKELEDGIEMMVKPAKKKLRQQRTHPRCSGCLTIFWIIVHTWKLFWKRNGISHQAKEETRGSYRLL